MLRNIGKWKRLILEAEFDRVTIPLYYASARGKRVPLLKTLLTNICKNQCKYCPLRLGKCREGLTWSVDKLAKITFRLWKGGIIKGLFLSSSIPYDPDYVVEREIEVAEKLRQMGFTGYIHLRLMPGVSKDLIWRAALVADRVGVNIEAPNKDTFEEIAPDKADFKNDILKRLMWASYIKKIIKRERPFGYLRAGVDTQVIVGAVKDTDLEYLEVTYKLYKNLGLRRVYYSGFRPIRGTPLERSPPCPLNREYRLYQASFLIRDYNFTLDDLKSILKNDMLPNEDLKLAFARANPNLYPIDPNIATFQEFLKVPGIGPISARRLLQIRSVKGKITPYDIICVLGRKRAKLALKYLDVPYNYLISY